MLKSVDQVIEELGGPAKTAALVRLKKAAISQWKARGSIPLRHFFKITGRLAPIEVKRTVFSATYKRPIDRARSFR